MEHKIRKAGATIAGTVGILLGYMVVRSVPEIIRYRRIVRS